MIMQTKYGQAEGAGIFNFSPNSTESFLKYQIRPVEESALTGTHVPAPGRAYNLTRNE
jgi:hypothetical protein